MTKIRASQHVERGPVWVSAISDMEVGDLYRVTKVERDEKGRIIVAELDKEEPAAEKGE